MIVKCPTCETKYKLDPTKFTSPEPKIRCKKCNNVFKAVDESATEAPAAPAPSETPPPQAKAEAPVPPPAAPAPVAKPASKPAAAPAQPKGSGKQLVIIGHESPDVTEMVTELLGDAGFDVIAAHDGIQALLEIEGRRPAVAILDVALPKMFGFEIVEVVRRDHSLAGTKIMLIAAIYDKTRYKRNPQSLYGADDYVEKHLIPDNIVEKVTALAAGATAPAPAAAPAQPAAVVNKAAPQAAPTPAPAASAAPAASGFDESSLTPEEKEDHEKAKRLARIIVSDIALYSADALVEGLKNGNPLDAVQRDLDEGKKLFAERVPANMRDRFDYLGTALEDLFAKKRKELGLAV